MKKRTKKALETFREKKNHKNHQLDFSRTRSTRTLFKEEEDKEEDKEEEHYEE